VNPNPSPITGTASANNLTDRAGEIEQKSTPDYLEAGYEAGQEGEPEPREADLKAVVAASPWQMPRTAWVRALKRVWVMSSFHNISLLAGGTAFFAFLAITPIIAATVMTYGLIGDVHTVQAQMQAIITAVPHDVAKLIQEQLLRIVTTSTSAKGFGLILALFFAIYGGMQAASGIIGALNVINEESETRGIVTLTLRAAVLTLAAIGIAAIGLLSGGVFAWLQTRTGFIFGPTSDVVFKVLTWLAAVLLGSAGFAIIMRFGPDRRPAKWRWLAPGALLATMLWLLISFGFSLYVAYVSDYSATYGSLAAIVVFLMWLFLSSYGILIGASLNVEIERQTECDTTKGRDRLVGERGSVIADTVDHSIPTAASLEKRRRRHADRARRKAHGEPEPVE
jgi:membrane protein